jgi:hypothetical protein
MKNISDVGKGKPVNTSKPSGGAKPVNPGSVGKPNGGANQVNPGSVGNPQGGAIKRPK